MEVLLYKTTAPENAGAVTSLTDFKKGVISPA